MPFYQEPPYSHGTPEKTAVVLLNLGTPDEPATGPVRRYLKEFLSDPRVVEIPGLIWWLILNGLILPTRPSKSAAKYASIWTPDGSPLRVHTEKQTKLIKGFLGNIGHPVEVAYAMRYGHPSVPEVIEQLRAQNCRRILFVPLYPQYAGSTTGTAFDAIFRHLRRVRNVPEIRTVRGFAGNTGYIDALAATVRQHWMNTGKPFSNYRLVLSFHGVPRFTLDKGDPYFCECHKTARLLEENLGLKHDQVQVCFQSRFGRAEWLQPYTSQVLETLAKTGVSRVDVMCPGFVSDCLETLEEIAMEGKELFKANGGKEFHYIPCLNERPDWIRALTDIILQNLSGWPTRTEDQLKLTQTATRSEEVAWAHGARH